MHDKFFNEFNPCGHDEFNQCNCRDTPNFCPPPQPPFCPQPPAPSVVQGMSLYEVVNDLSRRVNVCIDTYNHVMAENYKTLRNLEKQAEENGSYYGNCEVWVEEGYSAEESAAYKIIHKKVVDRRGEPIRLELHFAYNNTTNSKIEQSIASASKIELADKIIIAQPKTDKGWYGNVIWHGAPLPSDPEAGLYSVGFTRSGQMKVYSNSVSVDRMISDGIENSMGCSGVLVQNGEITDTAWYENIPDYNIQSSRVLLGQNFTTQEVMIFVTGKENDESKQGMTSLRCAQILKDYGCNLVVEIGEGLNAGAMDKGSLLFTPENKQMPNAYAFWYISRKCYYRNDYERELAELVQNYGACMWQGYLNKENILDLRDDLNTEIEERKNADSVLQDNIDKEQARAEEAERVLQENIDKEQERAEAAEDLLDKAIKAEQARAEGRENEIETNLNAEITRAKEAERVLQENIDKEQARAEAAETLLQQNLDKETAERKAEDSKLSERINAEQERAEAAETLLQSNIEKEENRATEAERVLQSNINKEQARAEAAEQALQTNIDKEVSRATTAEDTLRDSLSTEATARINADNDLQTKIETATTDLTAKINQEISDRQSSDTALETRINATITALTARVETLEGNIVTLTSLTNKLQEQMTALDTTVSSLSNLISTIETALNNVKTDVNNIKLELVGIKDGSVDLPYIKRVDGTGTGTHHLENLIISGDETVDSLDVLTSCTVPEPTANNNAATKKYVDDKVYNYINNNLINTITLWTYPTNYNQEIALTDYGVTTEVQNKFKKAAFINVKLPAKTGTDNYASLAVQYDNDGTATSAVGQAKIFANNQKAYADVIITISFDNWTMSINPDWHHMFSDPEKEYDVANKQYVDDKANAYLPLAGGTMATSETNSATINWDMTKVSKANRAPFINVDCSNWSGTDTKYFSVKGTNLGSNNVEFCMDINGLQLKNNTQNSSVLMQGGGIVLTREESQNCEIEATNNNLLIRGLKTPALDNQAANKKYVDDQVSAFKNIAVVSKNQYNYNAVIEWNGSSRLTLPEKVNFSTPIMFLWLPLYDKTDQYVSAFAPIFKSQAVPMLPAEYVTIPTKVGTNKNTNIDIKIAYADDGTITLIPLK